MADNQTLGHKVWWGLAVASFWTLVALTASLPFPIPSNQVLPEWDFSTGSTAWMLLCAIFGFCIGPFFAYFWSQYSGADTKKSVLMGAVTSVVVTMMWILFTYSLVWGEDAYDNGIAGYPKTYFMFHNTGAKPHPDAPLIPSSIFAMYELSFAILTPTILGMYMLERINLKGWIAFTLAWHMTVWCPVAHITWGPNGILKEWRIEDFSGGIVVNICASASMLAGKFWYDKMQNGCCKTVEPVYEDKRTSDGNSSVWSFIYVFILWFAIHAGKAHGADSVAAQSVANTFAGVMASWFTDILLEVFRNGNLDEFNYINFINSSLIALIALVPASGFVTVGGAMVITVISNLFVKLWGTYVSGADNSKPIDAFTLHGVVGTLGFLLTACLSYKYINPSGENGLTYGVGETLAYHICVTLVLFPMIWLQTLQTFVISDKLCSLSNMQNHAALPTSDTK